MAVVSIRVNGKDYKVACGEGEEERLRVLADELDERVQTLNVDMAHKPGEAMGLLLAGLMLADELSEKQREIEELAAEAKRAVARASVKRDFPDHDTRMADMEAAMAATMEEIAGRIEKLADKIEIA